MDVQTIVALGLPIWLGVEEIIHRCSASASSATTEEAEQDGESPEEILRRAA